MNITIHNVEESEPAHLAACIQWVRAFYDHLEYVSVVPQIYCREREPSGWIEYSLRLPYVEGGQIAVAAIQRNLGHELEFHS